MRLDSVFGISWRVLFVAWMASKVADSVCFHLNASHWVAVAVVGAIVTFAVAIRGPTRRARADEQCGACGKMHGSLSSSLGPRVDAILRVEGLVAAVLLLMSWCEHCEWSTDSAYLYAGGIALLIALLTAQLGGCHRCDQCGCAHFTLGGRRPTVAWGPRGD